MSSRTTSLALCGAAFIQMAGVGMIVALLPGMLIEFSGSMKSVGYIASAFALPFVLFQLPAGYLADRFGFKGFLVAGYAVCGLSGFVYFNSDCVVSLLAGRMLQGIGEVPIWALGPALLSLLFSRSKGVEIGNYNASIHLGLTAGSLLCAWACKAWSGREAFLFFGVCGLVGAILVALFARNPAAAGRVEIPSGYGQILRAIGEIRRPAVLAGVVLYGGIYGLFVTAIPGVLLSEKGFSQSEVAIFFSFFYVAVSISQIAAGKMTDTRGTQLPLSAGLLLIAGGLAPFMAFTGKTVYFFLFLASFGLGMFCIASMVLLNERVPASLKGSISGVFYLLWGVGYFLGPPFFTAAGELMGYGPAFSAAAVIVLMELFLLRQNPPVPRREG